MFELNFLSTFLSSNNIIIIDMPKNNTTMDSRLEYRFGGNGGVGGSMHSPSSHSPTKESLKNSER